MYTILVGSDNNLTTTCRERIMQRSKLVDTLCILACPTYNGYDMSKCTVLLEYVLPVSKRYVSEILVLSEEKYEDHLKYVLPFDTELTSEAGMIELQLTFVLADLDIDGNPIQRVRKTSTTTINIVPIAAWSDIIPDSCLTSIDQRIIKTDAQIKALADCANIINESKADNIKYDSNSNTLQLMSGGKEIGDKVTVYNEEYIKDGIPVVDFNDASDNDEPVVSPMGDKDDVVEF